MNTLPALGSPSGCQECHLKPIYIALQTLTSTRFPPPCWVLVCSANSEFLLHGQRQGGSPGASVPPGWALSFPCSALYSFLFYFAIKVEVWGHCCSHFYDCCPTLLSVFPEDSSKTMPAWYVPFSKQPSRLTSKKIFTVNIESNAERTTVM